MDVRSIPLYGSSVRQNPVAAKGTPFVRIPGRCQNQPASLCLSRDTLGRHAMLIGGQGAGNPMYSTFLWIRSNGSWSPRTV